MARLLYSLLLSFALLLIFGITNGSSLPNASDLLPEACRLAPDWSLRREATKRWASLGFKTQIVQANGARLFIATSGEGHDPILLLHRYPQSGEEWREIAPTLAETRRVVVVDIRGMGLSSIEEGGYDLINVAEDIHQLVIKLGFKQVNLLGHDWGGAVSAVYALRYPSEVIKLAFVESSVAGLGFEDFWTFNTPNPIFTFIPFLLSGFTEDLMIGREDIFLRYLWRIFTANKSRAPFESWKAYVAAMKRPGLVESSAGYYRAVYEVVDEIRKIVSRGKLDIPVLSISGEASLGDDQIEFVRAFANNIANHTTVPGAGHFVPEEKPDMLLKNIIPFFG